MSEAMKVHPLLQPNFIRVIKAKVLDSGTTITEDQVYFVLAAVIWAEETLKNIRKEQSA